MSASMESNVRNNRAKKNILIRVAAVLLCLTLLSTHFVGGLFARYTAEVATGGQARVARFSVEGGDMFSQSIDAALIPGASFPALIEITNGSEVAVEYTVTVFNATKNLPLSLRLEKADGAAVDGLTVTEQLPVGAHTDRYKLYIDWPPEKNDPSVMGQVDDITVKVTATQID